MTNPLYRPVAFVVYQLGLLVGIALLPVALLAHHVGLPLQVGSLVERSRAVYESATDV